MHHYNIIKSAAISELLLQMRKQSYDLNLPSNILERAAQNPTPAPRTQNINNLIPNTPGPSPSLTLQPSILERAGGNLNQDPSSNFGFPRSTPKPAPRSTPKPAPRSTPKPAPISRIAQVPGYNESTLGPGNAPYIIPNPVTTDYNAWFRNNKGGAYDGNSAKDKAEMEKLKTLGAEYQKQYGEEFDLGSEEAKTRMMNLRRSLKMPLR